MKAKSGIDLPGDAASYSGRMAFRKKGIQKLSLKFVT
jgi:hypothetical protein